MNKLLIATRNQGKLKEISQFLSDLPIKILSLSDIGITDEFEEKGKTYQENSQNKAIFYAKLSGLPTISDDGGIEIDALGGAPGIKSRRWVGKDSTDEKIIEKMKKVSSALPKNNRKAFFKTVVYIPLYNILVLILNMSWIDAGLAAVILTILVKVVLYPLAKKSTITQAKMKEKEGELALIKEK